MADGVAPVEKFPDAKVNHLPEYLREHAIHYNVVCHRILFTSIGPMMMVEDRNLSRKHVRICVNLFRSD